MKQQRITLDDVTVNYLEWTGDGQPFVLVHGLSSNAQTWSLVAARLAAAGHRVVALDQRGHGHSDKASSGYDFATISSDLAQLIAALEVDAPIIAGQSWGGNVALDFAARFPGQARGFAFVDGGFIDLQGESEHDWETVSARLRPPEMDGMPRSELAAMIRAGNPEWSEAGIEATLDNFQRLADGTIRRWLSIPNHMQILRALWEQRPQTLYPLVQEPVLIAVSGDPQEDGTAWRAAQITAALNGLRQVGVYYFPQTAHDIHVHRPAELAELLLAALRDGLWSNQ